MDYARALRVARAVRGLSQGDLARRAGLAPSYISRIEGGNRQPGREALEALAGALDLPVAVMELLAAPGDRLHGVGEAEAALIGRLLLELLAEGDGGEEVAR